jgi:hypothetical protein
MSTAVFMLTLAGDLVAIAALVASWRPCFSWHVDALYGIATACWMVRDIRTGDWGGAAWWALLATSGAWFCRDDYLKANRQVPGGTR